MSDDARQDALRRERLVAAHIVGSLRALLPHISIPDATRERLTAKLAEYDRCGEEAAAG